MLDYTCIILVGFGQLCFRTSFSDNTFSLYTIFIIRVGSLAGSEVEFSLIIVDGFRPFAFVLWNPMLDLTGLLDLPLFNIIIL